MEIVLIKEASLLREGMLKILEENFPDYKITAYNSEEYEALPFHHTTADLVMVDMDSKINIESAVHHYKKFNISVIIIWSLSNAGDRLVDLFKMDLCGYFYYGMDREELITGIRSVLSGKKYVHEALAPILLGDYVRLSNHAVEEREEEKYMENLSRREWEVLELLTKGCKNEQIAKLMYISEKTVKNHVSNILKKLAVPDRTNAVLKALRNRWFVI